jgi:lysophospholipase L1-like esterase
VPSGGSCQVDKSRVYVPPSDTDGCHRSDVAEVNSARLPVVERINIACSGAVTSDLLTSAQGGTREHGEQPEGDQLLAVARTHRVKAIVVSIGGNDLGFATIIADCLEAYEARTGPCKPKEQPKLAAGIPAAQAKVEHVIDSIRGVMHAAGYPRTSYRLIFQTYPSVAARAAENRYSENDPRRTTDGCANYDEDANWARDEASAEIDQMVAGAAKARGAELMDLHDLFQGHEVCAKTDAESTALSRPSPAGSEWGRFTGGSTVQQGDLQEAFHPNAFGQQAFAACLTAVYAAARGRFTCSSAAGRAPSAVTVARTATLTPKLKLFFRRHASGQCVRFTVHSQGDVVRHARVRFDGHSGRTGHRGRTTICGPMAAGRHRANVRMAGFTAAHRTVRVRRRRAG